MPARKTVEEQPQEETEGVTPPAPDLPSEEEQQEATDSQGPKVCAVCGKPATRVSNNPAVSEAYYCNDHGGDEPTKEIGGE